MFDQIRGNDIEAVLRDGTVVRPIAIPAGQDGWLDSVIIAFDEYDDQMVWNEDGTSMESSDLDIVALRN